MWKSTVSSLFSSPLLSLSSSHFRKKKQVETIKHKERLTVRLCNIQLKSVDCNLANSKAKNDNPRSRRGDHLPVINEPLTGNHANRESRSRLYIRAQLLVIDHHSLTFFYFLPTNIYIYASLILTCEIILSHPDYDSLYTLSITLHLEWIAPCGNIKFMI